MLREPAHDRGRLLRPSPLTARPAALPTAGGRSGSDLHQGHPEAARPASRATRSTPAAPSPPAPAAPRPTATSRPTPVRHRAPNAGPAAKLPALLHVWMVDTARPATQPLRARMGIAVRDREIALDTFLYLMSFLFGLLFGSFGNVVIWRLPRGESLSVPASHCPECDTPIAWYDNVPLVSWLVLLRQVPVVRGTDLGALPGGRAAVRACCGWPRRSTSGSRCRRRVHRLLLRAAPARVHRHRHHAAAQLSSWACSRSSASSALQSRSSLTSPRYRSCRWARGCSSIPVVYSLFGALVSAGSVLLIALVYSACAGSRASGWGTSSCSPSSGCSLAPTGCSCCSFGSLFGAVYGVVASRAACRGHAPQVPVRAVPRAGGGRRDAGRGCRSSTWYAGLLVP